MHLSHLTLVALLLGVDKVIPQTVTIDVHNAQVAQYIDARFIGVTLDSYYFTTHFKGINFSSQRLLTLARGLTPCYLRLGGTDADYVVFNKNSHVGRDVDKRFILNSNKYTFGTSDWDRVNGFVRNAGLDFIFDLNLSLRKNGIWDPTNAKELFQYSIQKGYKFAGIELGNEMEYNKDTHVTAQQSAQDFATLKQVINSMPGLSHPKIYGPAVAGIFYRSFTYAEDFLKAGGANHVDILTYHHYYTSGPKATVEMYHDHKVLDTLKKGLTSVMNARNKYAPGKTVWLGETSAAYSRAPGDLNRLYAASFPWLDKLGVAALYGVKGLMRQALYAGLVDEHTNPRNDYWVTRMYKQLVGNRVLKLNGSPNLNLRFYAHCTTYPSPLGYAKGSVTVYLMNLGSSAITVNINGAANQHLYMLSPGDNNGLRSAYIKLNGNVLRMTNDSYIPQFSHVQHRGSVRVEAYNMGFIVLTDIRKVECL